MTNKLVYLARLIALTLSSVVVAKKHDLGTKQVQKNHKDQNNLKRSNQENSNESDKTKAKASKAFGEKFDKIVDIIKNYSESSVSWKFVDQLQEDKMYDSSQVPSFINGSLDLGFQTKEGEMADLLSGKPGTKLLDFTSPTSSWQACVLPMVSIDMINAVSGFFDLVLGRFGEYSKFSRTNLYRQAVKFNIDASRNQIAQDLLVNALSYFAYKKSLETCESIIKLIEKNIAHINAKKEADNGSSAFDLEEQEMMLRKFTASVRSYQNMMLSTKAHLQKTNPGVNVESFLLDLQPYFEDMFKNAQSGCITINEAKLRKSPKNAPEFKEAEARFIADWHRLPDNFLVLKANQANAFFGISVNLRSIFNFTKLPYRFSGDAVIQHAMLKIENEINKHINDSYNNIENMNNNFFDHKHYKYLSQQKYRMWQSGGSRYELTIVDVRKTMIQAEQSKLDGIKAMLDALQNISKVKVVVGALINASK